MKRETDNSPLRRTNSVCLLSSLKIKTFNLIYLKNCETHSVTNLIKSLLCLF